MQQALAYQPPSGIMLGVYGASQETVRAASRVRDRNYLANPDRGFATVYLATVAGIERAFARASVRALGLHLGGTFAKVLDAVTLVGEYCPREAMDQIVAQVTEVGDVFYFAAPTVREQPHLMYRGQKRNVFTGGHLHLVPALMPEADVVFMLKRAS